MNSIFLYKKTVIEAWLDGDSLKLIDHKDPAW